MKAKSVRVCLKAFGFGVALATLNCGAVSAQRIGDYPFQKSGGFRYADAADYTCLSIVESVRAVGVDDRTPAAPKAQSGPRIVSNEHLNWVEEVRIVDSLSLTRGSLVKIVVHTGARFMAYPFVAGKRYLVLANSQKNGAFVEPTWEVQSGIQGEPSKAANEIAAFAAFETQQTKLAKGDSPAWKLANSVADTLINASDESLRRTLGWLNVMDYPGYSDTAFIAGRPDFPFADRLRENVEGKSPYRMAKVYQVLCHWKVFGTEKHYVHLLIEASKSASAWTAPGDYFWYGGLGFSKAGTSDANYQWIDLTPEVWTNAITEAKSVPIRDYLFANFPMTTTDEQNQRLAFLLNDPSQGTQAGIVGHFARVYDLPKLGFIQGDAAEQFAWRNKSEALSYWRKRFGVVTP